MSTFVIIIIIVMIALKIVTTFRKPAKSKSKPYQNKPGGRNRNSRGKSGAVSHIPTIDELSLEHKAYVEEWNDSLHKERIHGLPGFSLEETFGTRGAIGAKGELKTAKILNELCFKYPELRVHHGVHLKGCDWDLDHIVILGNTAIIIDTKVWKGGYTYSVRKKKGDDLIFVRDGKEFKGGEVHLKGMVKKFKRSYPTEKLFSVLSLTNEKCAIKDNSPYGIDVISLKTLGEHINNILDNVEVNTEAPTKTDLGSYCLDLALVRDRV